MACSAKGELFRKADALAAKMHANDVRKGSSVPYVTHPRAVADMVLARGGDEIAAMIALLHDTLEDCDATEALFVEAFGEEVGRQVWQGVVACSDGVDANGVKNAARDGASWKERKLSYLHHIEFDPIGARALLVGAADKIHNASTILDDLADPHVGELIWKRFRAGKEQQLWYYRELVRVFELREARGELPNGVAGELRGIVARLG